MTLSIGKLVLFWQLVGYTVLEDAFENPLIREFIYSLVNQEECRETSNYLWVLPKHL